MYSKGSKYADLFAAEYPDKTAKMEHFIICRDFNESGGAGKVSAEMLSSLFAEIFYEI